MAKSNPRNGVKNSQRIRLFSLALIVATAVAYLPAWNGKPIWDDNAHITQPELRSWHGLVEVWTQVGATQQYYPLVHSVFWIEQKLWGDSVLGYHLINIFLHGFAAIVLLRILLRLKVPGAWLAAGLFALHPVQVESVAWISEIKNTLSGLFFFCSILAYLNFDQNRSRVAYFGSLSLSVDAHSIARAHLATEKKKSRTTCRRACFSGPAFPRTRLHQCLSVYLFFCRRPFSISRLRRSADPVRCGNDDGARFNCARKSSSATDDFLPSVANARSFEPAPMSQLPLH